MDTKKHEYQMEQWAILIRERMNSGKTVRAWCEENGVTMRKYYYWLKQIRQEHFDAALDELHAGENVDVTGEASVAVVSSRAESNTFVELSSPDSMTVMNGTADEKRPAAIVRAGGIEVDIFSDTSESFLRELIQVLRDA